MTNFPAPWVSIVLLAVAVILVSAAFYAWRYRRGSLVTALVVLLIGYTLQIAGHAFTLVSRTVVQQQFFSEVQTTGIIVMELSWLAVVLIQTGRASLLKKPWLVAAVMIVPLATLAVIWGAPPRLFVEAPLLSDRREAAYLPGPWFWMYLIYSYMLLTIAVIILLVSLRGATALMRRQIGVLLILVMLPWIGNIATVLRFRPWNLNLAPLASAVAGLFVSWGLLHYHLFGLVPIAHKTILALIEDAIIVLDVEKRVVDLNLTAQRLLGYSLEQALGQPAVEVLSGWPALLPVVTSLPEAVLIPLDGENRRQWYDVRVTVLNMPRGFLFGHTIVLREISHLVEVEQGLRASEEALKRQLALEQLVADVTRRLVNTTAVDLDGEVTCLLRAVGEFVAVQRCYIMIAADDGVTIERLYEWRAPGSKLPPVTVSSGMAYEWALTRLRRFEIVEVADTDNLPVEAVAEQAYWRTMHTRSALALPLVVNGRLFGVMGFSSEYARSAWAAEDVRLLRLLGEVLVNVFVRIGFERALQASEAELHLFNERLEALVEERTTDLAAANEDLQLQIAQRARVEQALRLNEKRIQTLLQVIPDTIWVVTFSGQIIECWHGAIQQDPWLGCSGAPCELADVLPAAAAGQVLALVRGVSADSVASAEFRLEKDERWQEFEARAVALTNDQALVILRNISEQKAAERQLVRTERLVALGQLVASITHVINDFLQIIQNYLDLLLDFPTTEAEQRKYLQSIRQAMQRLSRITTDILTLARSTAGPPAIVAISEPADVAEVIQSVLVLAGKRLQRERIQVSFSQLADTARVMMPADQLFVVCLNLVVNAVEALQERMEKRLCIIIERDDQTVTASFVNNGPSIPADVLPHIQEPFYTTKPAGSGLGLWICYNLLYKSNGRMAVRNLPGDSGVVFDIIVPVAA